MDIMTHQSPSHLKPSHFLVGKILNVLLPKTIPSQATKYEQRGHGQEMEVLTETLREEYLQDLKLAHKCEIPTPTTHPGRPRPHSFLYCSYRQSVKETYSIDILSSWSEILT